MAEGLRPWRQDTIGAGGGDGAADGDGSAEASDGVGDGLSGAVRLGLGLTWVEAGGEGLLCDSVIEEPQPLRTTATARMAYLDRIGSLGLTTRRCTGYGRQNAHPYNF